MVRVLSIATLLGLALATSDSAQPAPSPMELGRLWDAEHLRLPIPPLLRHDDVVRALERLTQAAPDLISIVQVGESVEGRSLNHVWLGHGPFKVLLWSQMHGDEPTATAALLDLLNYVRQHRDEPLVRRPCSIGSSCTWCRCSILTAPNAFNDATRKESTSTATRCSCNRPRDWRSRNCAID